jgi:hypothetical protein
MGNFSGLEAATVKLMATYVAIPGQSQRRSDAGYCGYCQPVAQRTVQEGRDIVLWRRDSAGMNLDLTRGKLSNINFHVRIAGSGRHQWLRCHATLRPELRNAANRPARRKLRSFHEAKQRTSQPIVGAASFGPLFS